MTADARHLVHGMGTALVTPTWPAITLSEAESVLARFPVAGRVIALHWHSPRPFSAAALIQTSCGEFLLKRHHQKVRAASGLAEEHAFIAHLRAGGISVPEIMQADDGTTTVATSEWTYELHRNAPGIDLYRDRTSWTPFLSDAHAHAAGAALARLHLAARGFDAPPRQPQPLVTSLTILPSVDPLAATEAYVAARPALADFLADKSWQQELTRLFEQSANDLPARLTDQPPLWTHNDWHASNLLWASDGDVRTVFDFGLADRTNALHDLATAIERNAIAWLKLGQDDNIADPQAARFLISGYRTIIPLTAEDIETLTRLLPLVHLEFALSEVDYFHGVLNEPAHAAMAWNGYLIAHADWFASPPGQHFLKQIDRA